MYDIKFVNLNELLTWESLYGIESFMKSKVTREYENNCTVSSKNIIMILLSSNSNYYNWSQEEFLGFLLRVIEVHHRKSSTVSVKMP